MDRNQIEQAIRQAYAARVRGDAASVEQCFAPDAHFELAGGADTSPVAGVCKGADAFMPRLRALIEAFEMSDWEIASMVIEPPKAAVRSAVTVRSTATGQKVRTEVCDLFELRDGKIVSYVQFFDTAMANRLAGA